MDDFTTVLVSQNVSLDGWRFKIVLARSVPLIVRPASNFGPNEDEFPMADQQREVAPLLLDKLSSQEHDSPNNTTQ